MWAAEDYTIACSERRINKNERVSAVYMIYICTSTTRPHMPLNCTMSREVARGVFVQQESVFPWLKDDFLSHSFRFMWAFLIFCLVLHDVISLFVVAGSDCVVEL